MFGNKTSTREGSPLLRHAEGRGPTLFRSAMKSSHMTPVRLSNLPQSEVAEERGDVLPYYHHLTLYLMTKIRT